MTSIQLKVISHAKKEENTTHNEKNQSIKTYPGIIQMSESEDKDLKITVTHSTYVRR